MASKIDRVRTEVRTNPEISALVSDVPCGLLFGPRRRKQKSPCNGGWSKPGVEGAAIYSRSNWNPIDVAWLRHHMLFEG